MDGNVTRLVAAVAKFSCGRRDKALAKALVSALVESHALDHIGRLLLAVGQGPVGQAPPQPLARLQETALFRLSGAMHEVMAVSSVATTSDGPRPEMGGRPAALVLGASALALADNLGCGLPRSYLLAMPLNRGEAQPYPCVSGVVIEALLTSLLMDQEAPHPTVPRRAAIRLLLRVLRLASASVRATSQGTSRGPGWMVRVDVGGMGGRQVETQEYRALLAPKSSGLVAIQAMNLLAGAARIESQAWVAEAGPAWALLFASVRHAIPALGVEHQVTMAGALADLTTMVAQPLLTEGDRLHMVLSPALLPPCVVGALQGSLLPVIETLVRAVGNNEPGCTTESVVATGLLNHGTTRASIAAVLVHSPPREAAAFLATLAKALRRMSPHVLICPGRQDMAACLMLALACDVLGLCCQTAVGALTPGQDPAGPVDPAAPCVPVLVLSLAALHLLPEVSRLALEASARMLLEGDTPKPHVGFQRSLTAVSNLVGYAGRVWGATAAAPVATHRLAVACSFPSLVEDAGLGRLIGVLLALVSRFETIHSLQHGRACLNLARWCMLLHAAYPDRQWRSDGGGGSSSGGGVCLWEPGALYWVAAEVGRTEPQLCSEMTALAAWLERVLGREAPKEGPLPAGIALLAERLAALKAEARALLPACANPACANLAGDSEAGLRLQRCAGCQAVSYCCKECQTAHWLAGHKAACGGKTG